MLYGIDVVVVCLLFLIDRSCFSRRVPYSPHLATSSSAQLWKQDYSEAFLLTKGWFAKLERAHLKSAVLIKIMYFLISSAAFVNVLKYIY